MENHDVYIYTGDIHRDGYLELTNRIKTRKKEHGLRKDVVICVVTYGGDPNAGYRIGRALQHNYDTVTLLVVGPCKSAGTLIAIAAHKLVIGDMGELGPLDIQLKKNDEIGELSSGLAIMTALDALKDRSISAFNSHLVNIRYENQISTKMSADIATRLTEALIAPMAAQIDPIKLGEHQRAMTIAVTYGQRLSSHVSSLKDGALGKLIAAYPSHGFVIDRKEAKELFQRVERPADLTERLYDFFCEKIHTGDIPTFGEPKVLDFTCDAKNIKEEQNAEESEARDGVSQQDAGEQNPRKPRSDKRGGTKSKQDKETSGAASVQQVDGEQTES
ncbi:SppA protein [Salmonella enterica]|nr:SppA protein [Salmonella enterica]HAO4184373.1 SppA protein [Salmonella enterica]HCM1942177.1 SppA protein [Salmonella enterica subsp. salamae serovar 30:g,m,s:e,n,x]